MFNYYIFKDGKLLEILKNLPTDEKLFGYLLSCQGQSIDYALKYGGYLVEVENIETKKVTNYKNEKIIENPLCINYL